MGNVAWDKIICDTERIRKWDTRYMQLCQTVASWSKDPSTKVGAILVNEDNKVIGMGYNGYPKPIDDINLDDRTYKYDRTIHAEMNAMISANTGILDGCTLYVWPLPPCSTCMAILIELGLSNVVTVPLTDELEQRWGASIKTSLEIAAEAGVEIRYA